MRKFFVLGGLMALIASQPASALNAAGGEVVVQGLRVMVESSGINATSESAFVRAMGAAGFKHQAAAIVIYNGIIKPGAGRALMSKMRFQAADWGKLQNLAKGKTGLQVVNTVRAALQKSSVVNYNTLAQAFQSQTTTASAVKLPELTEARLEAFIEKWVPLSDAGNKSATDLESGDPELEARAIRAYRLAATAYYNAPHLCGSQCSPARIERMQKVGVRGAMGLVQNIDRLNYKFPDQAYKGEGPFQAKKLPFHIERYWGGLDHVQEQAAAGALDQQIRPCVITN